MKTRAAVLVEMGRKRPYAESRPLEVVELDLEAPGPGEVLVRVEAAGLCHSDLSAIDGNRPRPVPMVLGHEGAGVVEAVGTGVAPDDLAVDDHVVMVFVPGCGACVPCMEGRPALCTAAAKANVAGTLITGARRLSWNGKPVNHLVGVSCFAERCVVSRRSLVKVDRRLPLDKAALFGCAVITGVGAALNTGGLKAGQKLAVVGMGGVGLNALLGGLAAGASQVVALDLDPRKLELARQLGATAAFDARAADVVEQVRAATGGGVDVAVETAGAAPAVELAYAVTGRGGTTVTAGLAHPDRKVSVQQVSLVGEERTLKGSYMGSCVPARDIPRYIALNEAGRLPVERVLSDYIRLDDINAGFD
ncbi:MAG: zinc-binding dehydrogenase, partial [Alphaproteobacteria bacterium]|nr:zinc-binding dehydrogenase [Alphaproteobacteria bacterium]